MTGYDLPNPFLFLSGCQPAGAAAPVSQCSLPSGESDPAVTLDCAGAAAGYPCCHDCGRQPPCDRHCPNAALPGLTISRAGDALDEAAFLSEIEPVPAFISRRTTAEEIEALLELARAEEWPAPPSLRRANG